ncbi:MAG TPA: hypothetical protein VJM53_11055, partial [Burkholderiales bacterium]|nr:hypothetical protein [Burkholderiales bacterium]
MEKVTAYKPEDVEAGGRLEHLERAANRSHDRQALAEGRYDEIISYHWSIWGMHAAKLTAFRSTEHPDPYGATDAELKKEAIAMIKAHPLDHLVMTLPFIWRGAPFLFPLLLYTLYYAWRRHEASLAAYVLPSLGLIMFHALLSHFIPRYAISNVPIGAICFVLLLHRWVASRNRTTRSGETTQSTIRSA